MNSRGECRPRRRADQVAESLARELEQAQLANEAHEAALKILRTRLAEAEEILTRVAALADGLRVDHLSHAVVGKPCPSCGHFQARLRAALIGGDA